MLGGNFRNQEGKPGDERAYENGLAELRGRPFVSGLALRGKDHIVRYQDVAEANQ